MSDNLARMDAIVANNVEANRVANENLKARLDESTASFKATTAKMTANQIKQLLAKISQSDSKIDKMNEILSRLISELAVPSNAHHSPWSQSCIKKA